MWQVSATDELIHNDFMRLGTMGILYINGPYGP